MLRGGSLRSTMMGGSDQQPTLNATNSAPEIKGDIDSRLVEAFDWSPLKSNSSVAKVSYDVIQPVSDATTSTTLQYNIPASTQPGLMYDLSKSTLLVKYSSGAPSPGQSGSWWQRYFTVAQMWNSIRLKLAGVSCDNSCDGAQPFATVAWYGLTEPHSTCDEVQTAAGDAFSIKSRYLESGIVTPAAHYTAMPNTSLSHDQRNAFVAHCQNYNGEWLASRWAHPMWNEQQSGLVPASVSVDLQIEKLGGNELSRAKLAYFDATETYQPTITYELRLCRVQLSQVGFSLYKALLAEHSMMKYNVTRIRTQQYQIAVGATSHNALQVGSKKPSCLAIWFNDSTLLTENILQSSILQCQVGSSGGAEPTAVGHIAPIQSMKIRCAGETYPKNSEQAISRSTYGHKAHGGSFQTDLEAYKRLAQQYQSTYNEVQPLFSAPFFADGGFEIFYVNLRDDDSPLFGHANETVSGDIEIITQFQSALTVNTTMTVVSFTEENVMIDPVNSRVSTSW